MQECSTGCLTVQVTSEWFIYIDGDSLRKGIAISYMCLCEDVCARCSSRVTAATQTETHDFYFFVNILFVLCVEYAWRLGICSASGITSGTYYTCASARRNTPGYVHKLCALSLWGCVYLYWIFQWSSKKQNTHTTANTRVEACHERKHGRHYLMFVILVGRPVMHCIH